MQPSERTSEQIRAKEETKGYPYLSKEDYKIGTITGLKDNYDKAQEEG